MDQSSPLLDDFGNCSDKTREYHGSKQEQDDCAQPPSQRSQCQYAHGDGNTPRESGVGHDAITRGSTDIPPPYPELGVNTKFTRIYSLAWRRKKECQGQQRIGAHEQETLEPIHFAVRTNGVDDERGSANSEKIRQSGGGIYVLDLGPESTSGDANDSVFSAARDPAFGLRVPVRRYAALGAVCWRTPARHAFSAYCERYSVEGQRHAGNLAGSVAVVRIHAGCWNHRPGALPPHTRLTFRLYRFSTFVQFGCLLTDRTISRHAPLCNLRPIRQRTRYA
jgi:hypothetical protein